jgi:hypothetical protein
MIYGTLSTLDAIATSQATIAEIGEDRAFDAVTQALAAHNMLVDEALRDLVDVTEDNLRRYGGVDDTDMEEVDQFGRSDAAKAAVGVTVGFPLRLYQRTLQWNRAYMEVTTGREFAAQVDAMLAADARNMHRQIRRAIFNSANNLTYTDALVNNVTLPLRALVNADSADMPLGPNGESFNSATHTHYLGTGSFVAANLDSLIDTVIEHYGAGQPVVEINQAQEATVRGFTGFAAYVDMRVVQPSTATYAQGNLDVVNFNNRAIGVYRGAEIWVKSARIPANYLFAWLRGAPKPLALRRRNAARGALRLVADNEAYPLRAQTREREFGVGVWNRTNGAVLYTANATYAVPSL